MIEIRFNKHFQKEKQYIADVLFGDFIQLEYNVKISTEYQNYIIKIDDNKFIEIKDSFFNNYNSFKIDKTR